MATLFQLAQIAASADFKARVSMAMVTAAAQVYSESPSTTGHVARAAFATKVFNGTFDLVAASLAVLSNATIAAEASISPGQDFSNSVPDGDLQFTVNSLWNTFSGA